MEKQVHQEWVSWQNVIKELNLINKNAIVPNYEILIRNIRLWGERLVSLRLEQDFETQAAALKVAELMCDKEDPMDLMEFDWSVRAKTVFQRGCVKTIKDIQAIGFNGLLMLRDCGITTAHEIKNMLNKFDIYIPKYGQRKVEWLKKRKTK
jgi:hypothetical protein